MEHSFNVEVAMKLGVNSAIILKNMGFWIAKNEANKKHFHDGYTWTYNSVRAWHLLFPYMSKDTIKRELRKLVNAGVVKTGNYNKTAYDRTLWYTIADKAILAIVRYAPMEGWETPNRTDENNQPIPDINTDINTDKDIAPSPKKEKDAIMLNALRSIKDTFHNEYFKKMNIYPSWGAKEVVLSKLDIRRLKEFPGLLEVLIKDFFGDVVSDASNFTSRVGYSYGVFHSQIDKLLMRRKNK